MTEREEPSLVPIERVACPTNEKSDNATRKIITQMQKSVAPRLALGTTGNGIDHQTRRYITLEPPKGGDSLRVALSASSKEYQLPPGAPIEMISGMCLFGASGLVGITESGRRVSLTDPKELEDGIGERVVSITELPLLHPSEVEAILRLTNAFRLLAEKNEQGGGGELVCSFHLPVPEYTLYMLHLFSMGVITQQQLIALVQTVTRRANDLKEILDKRIPIQKCFGSPLDVLNPVFAERGTETTLADCVRVLRNVPPFAALLQVSPPNSFLDLTKISYAAGYILVSASAKERGNGCMAVEITEETPIMKNAMELGEKIGVPLAMLALYISQSTVTLTGRRGKQALFMHEPNGDSPLAALVTVVKNSKKERV